MAKGFIYIMTNPAFPQYVKIGYADDVQERLKVLNSNSGLPLPFKVYAEYEVKDRLTDKTLHKLIDAINPNLRLSKNREFYDVSAENAYSWLKAIAAISDTEERLIGPSNEEQPVSKPSIISLKTSFSKYTIGKEEFDYKSATQCFVELCEQIIKLKGSSYFRQKISEDKHLQNRRTYNANRSSDESYILSDGYNINKHGSATELLKDAKILCNLCEDFDIQFSDGGNL